MNFQDGIKYVKTIKIYCCQNFPTTQDHKKFPDIDKKVDRTTQQRLKWPSSHTAIDCKVTDTSLPCLVRFLPAAGDKHSINSATDIGNNLRALPIIAHEFCSASGVSST